MAEFSIFDEFGLFEFSSGPSMGEKIYRSLIAAKSPAFNTDVGEPEEAKIYAQAMGLARAQNTLERAQSQEEALRAVEMLPIQEEQWGIVPGENETIHTRQENLAMQMLVPRGARRENVETILRSILGTDFLAYRVVDNTEIDTWPTLPFTGPGNFVEPRHEPKNASLIDPIATTGSQKAYYLSREVGDKYLIGETLTFDRENSGLAEQVTVTDAGTDSVGDFFVAVFTKPHAPTSSITAGPCPIWVSNKRTVFVIVKNPASINPETRRKVDVQMSRMMRAVTTWSIVEPFTPGGLIVGPLTLDHSLLGVTTIEALDFVYVDTGP